jgi:hypothetical protein
VDKVTRPVEILYKEKVSQSLVPGGWDTFFVLSFCSLYGTGKTFDVVVLVFISCLFCVITKKC